MGRVRQKSDAKKRRQIAFDLCIASLKEYYPRPQNSKNEQYYNHAYDDICKFMKRNGFKHRQGSVYISANKITRAAVHGLLEAMVQEMPWLYKCVEKMDLTVIESQEHDLTGYIRDATLAYLKNVEPIAIDALPDSLQSAERPTQEDKLRFSPLQDLINAAEEVKHSFQLLDNPIEQQRKDGPEIE